MITTVSLVNFHDQELSAEQAGFRKGRGTRGQTAKHPLDHRKSSGIKKKKSASLTMLKPSTMWITTNCGKFLKGSESRPADLPLGKPICRSGSNS